MRHADHLLGTPLKKRCGLIVAALFALALGRTIPMQGQVPASEKRLWVLDLGSVPSYKQLKLQGREVPLAASVVFVDANTVAVTYRIADPTSVQATDAVSFFDANSGAFRNSLQWPTLERSSADRNFIRLSPTSNGEFLIVVGYSIRHYSAAQKELQCRFLENKSGGEWVVRVSPDGQLALAKIFGPGSHEDHWFFTDTLEDRSVVPAPFYSFGYGVGRDFVVYNPSPENRPRTNLIHVHTSTGEDRVLCAECKGVNFGIVNEQIFFGGLPPGTGVLTTFEGRTLLRSAFGRKNQSVSQVSVARESSRVAF